MKRDVTFRVRASEGQIVVTDEKGNPYTVLHCNVFNYADLKLVLGFNKETATGTLGDCVVRPTNHDWGIFETLDGFVLVRSDFHVGWLFWSGTYPDGVSIVPCVRFDDAIQYKTKAAAMVALAVLNIIRLEKVNG